MTAKVLIIYGEASHEASDGAQQIAALLSVLLT
jgi:hypothetical protein